MSSVLEFWAAMVHSTWKVVKKAALDKVPLLPLDDSACLLVPKSHFNVEKCWHSRQRLTLYFLGGFL